MIIFFKLGVSISSIAYFKISSFFKQKAIVVDAGVPNIPNNSSEFNLFIKDFGKIQSRTFIASKFVEKGAGVIMRTSKDNFVLIFPGLNDNREKNILMCENALKLIDLLNVDLTKGCFQINGQIIFNIEDFKEYYNLLKTYDHPKKRYRRISK